MGLEEPHSNPSGHRRDLASDLEVLDGLLSTLTDVLDLREVFDRVSQLVQRLLPHDLMGVLEINETGDRVRIRMSAGADVPPNFETNVPQGLFTTPWDVILVDDIAAHPIFRASPALKAGMNSAMAVPIRFGGRLQAAVVFFSRQFGRFSRGDLPIAQLSQGMSRWPCRITSWPRQRGSVRNSKLTPPNSTYSTSR